MSGDVTHAVKGTVIWVRRVFSRRDILKKGARRVKVAKSDDVTIALR